MIVAVDCERGPDGEPLPRRLRFDHRVVGVVEIVDRWPGVDHQYVKLRGDDGALYIVRHDAGRGLWELTLFDAGRREVGPGARQR